MQHFFLAMHMPSPVPATSAATVYVIASDVRDQQVARDQMFHDMQLSTKEVLTTVPLAWDEKVHIMNLYKEKRREYETNSICFLCRVKGHIAAHCPRRHPASVGAPGQTQQLVPLPLAEAPVAFAAPAHSQPAAVGPTTGSIMAIAMPPGGEVTYYP